MKYLKLKFLMKEKGMTQKELADFLGVTIQTLNGKLNGKREFTIKEAKKILDYIGIWDPEGIFFSEISNLR